MRMKWYKKLYVGDIAREKKHTMIGKIRFRRFQRDAYLITLPSNGNNLLDIYPSYVLLQKAYKGQELFVVGLACGYEEALEVTRRVVEDVYQNTGGFDVRAFVCRGESF